MTKYILLTCFAGSLGAQTTLDVHVYDWDKVPASTLKGASNVLAGVCRVSGIALRWVLEPPDSPDAAKVVLVDDPRPGRERETACAARRDIALSILPDTSANLRRGVLGYAEPLAPAGINATVLYKRIVSAADAHGISIEVVLGHAIAHEIGHVLLRTRSHRKGGLMSSGWDLVQFRHMRTSGMYFDPADARFMHATITGRGCETSSAKR